MVKLAHYLSLVTIVVLNIILLIVAGSEGQILGHSANFGLLVNTMYSVLISSSLLLGYLNWKSHQKIWALLFLANICMVVIPTLLSVSGLIKLPSIVLIGFDLYWLNQYWLYVASRRN